MWTMHVYEALDLANTRLREAERARSWRTDAMPDERDSVAGMGERSSAALSRIAAALRHRAGRLGGRLDDSSLGDGGRRRDATL
jgi:hypothetical protein